MAECLEFFVSNLHCKHVILGVGHDSGYASSLGKFAVDTSIRNRITLLQGSGRVHPQIAALRFRGPLLLPSVFTQSKVVVVQPYQDSLQISSSSAKSIVNPGAMSERLGPVLRDDGGKRVDKFLEIDPNSPQLNALRSAKPCEYYYLRGKCWNCQNCQNSHAMTPLEPKEFDMLWYHARHALCGKVGGKMDCDDPRCIYGHERGNPIGSRKT